MNSIKTKLLLALLGSVLLPMIIVGFISGKNILDDTKPLFVDMANRELLLIDNYFELFFHDLQDTVNYLADKPALLNENRQLTIYKNNTSRTRMDLSGSSQNEINIYNQLKLFIDSHPNYKGIEFGTSYGGYIRYPLSDRRAGYNPPERGWYKEALKTPGKPIITKAAPSSDGTEIEVSIVKTVKKGNEIIGVVSVKITLNELSEIIKSIRIGEDGYVILVEGESTILADPIHTGNNFKNLSEVPDYKSLIESKFQNDQLVIDNEKATAIIFKSKSLNFKYIGFVHNEEILQPFFNFIKPLLITAGTLAVLFSLLSMFMARTISLPIKIIADILNNISEGQGDLTKELEVLTKDELGKMAKSFNAFTGTMNSMILSIKNSTIELTQMGDELSDDMEETSAAITQITANIDSTKDQINTQEDRVSSTSSAVEEITQNIESLNRMINDQVKAVNDSNKSIKEMISNIQVVNGNIDDLDNVFSELLASSNSGKIKINNVYERALEIASQSESLQETNKIISGIASQTNLLAMNAAIEAAHAGDAGKGFAVVADEIRKLAETSSAQSSDISNKLKEITSVIESVVQASKAAEEGFNLVTELIDRVNKLEEEIKKSMMKQMDESSHVSSSLEHITDLTTGVKQGSEEMKIGNEQILQDISTLSNISKQILHSIEEISLGNNEINNSVLRVTDMSRKNKETIQQVFDRVSLFKLKEE